ncbi:hypothetical protein ACSFA8_20850 [Variovorax sp. RT4R15]|uniref:hypothetical protein n=1 Tax=Variovorax sp. RT4R15 TaxID=3443737 RepID=UPI003F452E3C
MINTLPSGMPALPEPSFRLRWDGMLGRYSVNKPELDDTDCYTPEAVREIQAAAFAAGRAEARKELLPLLVEARCELPVAAASWNDDDDDALVKFHVPRVLNMIGRFDKAIAAISQEPK